MHYLPSDQEHTQTSILLHSRLIIKYSFIVQTTSVRIAKSGLQVIPLLVTRARLGFPLTASG